MVAEYIHEFYQNPFISFPVHRISQNELSVVTSQKKCSVFEPLKFDFDQKCYVIKFQEKNYLA